MHGVGIAASIFNLGPACVHAHEVQINYVLIPYNTRAVNLRISFYGDYL